MYRVLVAVGATFVALFVFYGKVPSLFGGAAKPETHVERFEGGESSDLSSAQAADSMYTEPPAGDQESLFFGESKNKEDIVVSIGEYLDPDRGADFSDGTEPLEIGVYIDPDRGADFSEPSQRIELGAYIDPDRGALLAVDPLEEISIGAFIDPDSLFSGSIGADLEVGEPMDPDRM